VFTVVGGGFGLYGYVPALIEATGPVVLPREYEATLVRRTELRPYLDRVRWTRDKAAALAQADGVVVAVPPQHQPEIVKRCLEHPAIVRLVLEKPLAASPAAADELLGEVERSGRRYRVGYTFLHADWARELRWPPATMGEVRLDWTFMAHHFAQSLDNWKRHHSMGGGPLRFFGVHVIALLARHGYDAVTSSALAGEGDEPHAWGARFAGPGLPECVVRVDSRAPANAFVIATGAGAVPLVRLEEPFELAPGAADAGDDRRVRVLRSLLATFDAPDDEYRALYARAHALWGAAELEIAR